jgi:hypothetical protein
MDLRLFLQIVLITVSGFLSRKISNFLDSKLRTNAVAKFLITLVCQLVFMLAIFTLGFITINLVTPGVGTDVEFPIAVVLLIIGSLLADVRPGSKTAGPK